MGRVDEVEAEAVTSSVVTTPDESEYAAAVAQTAIALVVTALFVLGVGAVEGFEKVAHRRRHCAYAYQQQQQQQE